MFLLAGISLLLISISYHLCHGKEMLFGRQRVTISCWHFAIANRILLAIYLHFQLTHSESTLSQLMFLCGLSSVIALLGIHRCLLSWTILWVSTYTVADSICELLKWSSFPLQQLPYTSRLCDTTLPCKAAFSVVPSGCGRGHAPQAICSACFTL